jgi:YggT family protein
MPMLQQIAGLLVDAVAGFFVYLLLARFLFQWMRVPFRNPLGAFVIAATNWMVAPARRVIPALGGLDLASLVLAWLLQALALAALYGLAGWGLGAIPEIPAAAFAALAVVDLLRFAAYIYMFALIVQAVLSWVNPYSPVAPVFDALTQPFLRPIRRVLPPLGGVDLSPLVLIVLLQVLLIPLGALRGAVGGLF